MDNEELAARVEALEKYGDNSLDVEVEIALFKPTKLWTSIRSNNAGTKVIYTNRDGDETTYWPRDHTMRPYRDGTISALRARGKQ